MKSKMPCRGRNERATVLKGNMPEIMESGFFVLRLKRKWQILKAFLFGLGFALLFAPNRRDDAGTMSMLLRNGNENENRYRSSFLPVLQCTWNKRIAYEQEVYCLNHKYSLQKSSF